MVKAQKQAPKQGEIVWVDFDPQSGHEQAGRRPAHVLRTPLTTKKSDALLFAPSLQK